MKVKCIETGGFPLTVGRVYEVLSEEEELYLIMNDSGRSSKLYLKTRFEIVEEAAPAADQWDTAARGPKMATVTGKAILKYQMPVLEQFEMKLPEGAEIIRMEDQAGMFWLWAVVDIRKPDETRKFRAFKTGATIPDDFTGTYRGFCKIHVQQELGLYIFEDAA